MNRKQNTIPMNYTLDNSQHINLLPLSSGIGTSPHSESSNVFRWGFYVIGVVAEKQVRRGICTIVRVAKRHMGIRWYKPLSNKSRLVTSSHLFVYWFPMPICTIPSSRNKNRAVKKVKEPLQYVRPTDDEPTAHRRLYCK